MVKVKNIQCFKSFRHLYDSFMYFINRGEHRLAVNFLIEIIDKLEGQGHRDADSVEASLYGFSYVDDEYIYIVTASNQYLVRKGRGIEAL